MIQLQYLGALSEYNTIRLKYGHKFNIIVLGQPYLCVAGNVKPYIIKAANFWTNH